MKRLLLPLIAALALPTAVIAGDLGIADLEKSSLRGKTYEEYPDKKFFEYNCGMAFSQFKKCSIDFNNGKLSVDKSYGILPSQLKHVGIADVDDNPTISIIYEDRAGKMNHAGFAHMNEREAFAFTKAFMKLMNSEK
tara:strand:- start:119 stop:529 length:411 start_codon:yes stop_codon:yes gene_type:complete